MTTNPRKSDGFEVGSYPFNLDYLLDRSIMMLWSKKRRERSNNYARKVPSNIPSLGRMSNQLRCRKAM